MEQTFRALRLRILGGERVFGVMVQECHGVGVMAVLASAGMDFCVLDTESTDLSLRDVRHLARAAADVGVAPLVRVSGPHDPDIRRVLDLGAEGIVVPDVRDADEAAVAVAACHYPPAGSRGVTPRYAATGKAVLDAHGVAAADERVLTVFQIESGTGVQNAAAIAATPGVDVVLIGVNDLALDLGVPGQTDALVVLAAVEAVAAEVSRAQKVLGGRPGPGVDEPGFVIVASDMDLLWAGATGVLERYRPAARAEVLS